jgi:glucose/arabinose dehydrogenase
MRVVLITALMCWLATDLPAQVRSRVYASGFSSPVAIVQDPTDAAVQFVVQLGGRIRPVRSGTVIAPDFLDVSAAVQAGGEQGLLGLAFAPDYVTSRRFYINFTNRQGHTVIARFKRSDDPLIADAASRFDLRWNGAGGDAVIAQPFSNHNGGHLAFGPDGYLYVGLGDGGSGNDPDHRAQNPNELLGKMLRVDVGVPDSDAIGYRIPEDNPFVAARPIAARPEIWAFGLRNPWRYAFDDPARGGTGALVIGDVGQSAWEEIDYEPRGRGGRNYGWRNREGAHDNITSRPLAYLPVTEPIFEYDRSAGQSITGGIVYRGSALGAAFRGRYLFADYVQGRVWSIAVAVDGAGEGRAADLIEHTTDLGGSTQLGQVSSFGVDAQGEVFIINFAQGRILRIVGVTSAPATPTGLRIIKEQTQ